jgi:hypothetical protein
MRWRKPSSTPRCDCEVVKAHCPKHPNTHPLNARLHDGIAVWTCGESDVIAPIGDLFSR